MDKQQLLDILDGPITKDLVKRREQFEKLTHIPSRELLIHQELAAAFKLMDDAWRSCADWIRTDDPVKRSEFVAQFNEAMGVMRLPHGIQ